MCLPITHTAASAREPALGSGSTKKTKQGAEFELDDVFAAAWYNDSRTSSRTALEATKRRHGTAGVIRQGAAIHHEHPQIPQIDAEPQQAWEHSTTRSAMKAETEKDQCDKTRWCTSNARCACASHRASLRPPAARGSNWQYGLTQRAHLPAAKTSELRKHARQSTSTGFTASASGLGRSGSGARYTREVNQYTGKQNTKNRQNQSSTRPAAESNKGVRRCVLSRFCGT